MILRKKVGNKITYTIQPIIEPSIAGLFIPMEYACFVNDFGELFAKNGSEQKLIFFVAKEELYATLKCFKENKIHYFCFDNSIRTWNKISKENCPIKIIVD